MLVSDPSTRRDEDPVGKWTLRVKDRQNNGNNGTFVSWSMQLWGSAIDATKAEPYRLPGDPDDEDATYDEDASATIEPTKTFDRPTSHLPDDHAEQTGEAHLTFGESYTSPALEPTPAPDAESAAEDEAIPVDDDVFNDEGDAQNDSSDSESGSLYDSLYGSTAGALSGMRDLVGSTTWLFVAVGVIVVFVAAVTAFFWMRRRPARRGGGGGYDFAPMTDDDDVPMSAMERGGLLAGEGGRRQSARTRELFNAFALHSDEEDEEDESDDDDERRGGSRSKVAYTEEAVSEPG